MTVAEIKAALDAAGIEYPAGAKKAELESLLPKEGAEPDGGMVKATVVRAFQDIHTLEDRAVGDVIEVTEERFAEINTAREYVKRA